MQQVLCAVCSTSMCMCSVAPQCKYHYTLQHSHLLQGLKLLSPGLASNTLDDHVVLLEGQLIIIVGLDVLLVGLQLLVPVSSVHIIIIIHLLLLVPLQHMQQNTAAKQPLSDQHAAYDIPTHSAYFMNQMHISQATSIRPACSS